MTIKQPNVILIFADDLGIGDVSAFNPESKIQTKHLDYLTTQGIRFTDSHATSALCTPSRYSLLTGRYNWRSPLKSMVLTGDSEPLIENDRITLAQMLKNNGYRTAIVGKWHLGLGWQLFDEPPYEKYGIDPRMIEQLEIQQGRAGAFEYQNDYLPTIEGLDIDYSKPLTHGPITLGFDYFYGTAASLDQPPYVIIENDRVIEEPTVISGLPGLNRRDASHMQAWQIGPMAPEHSPYHLPDQMQNKVLELMDDYIKDYKINHKPFFLYYPNHLVHQPILPNAAYKDSSGVGIYGDFVKQLDGYVGEIIEKLEQAGVFEDTIVIFTSDNGVSGVADLLHLQAHGHHSSMHYRGIKSDIWEGGHREPTIISYPPIIEKNSVSDFLISHSDIYATIADLLNLNLEDHMAEDSISNLPLWKGQDTLVRHDMVHSSGNGGFSIRKGFWKLNLVNEGGGMGKIVDPNYNAKYEPMELFYLKEDLSESINLIDDYPDKVQELTRLLTEYIKSGRSTAGKPQKNSASTPHGNWPQIHWMNNSQTYLRSLNQTLKHQ